MEFRIADTFTGSLARLNGPEQKAVKTTAFDLQLNLSNPGLRFHRLDRPRDPNFWSVRVFHSTALVLFGWRFVTCRKSSAASRYFRACKRTQPR